MTHTLKIMDHTGHATVEWELDAKDAIAEAQRICTEKMAEGYLAVAVEGPVTKGQLKAFDPEATEIVMIPRYQGG